MPIAAPQPTKIQGEDVSLNIEATALVAAGASAYDLSARGANIFADLSGQQLPAGCELSIDTQPNARARIFLKFSDTQGPLRCALKLAEGSETDVYAHIVKSDVQLVFAAELKRHATARFFGLTQTSGDQHSEIVVDVHHVQGENLSEQKFYSFAADNSTIGFTGKITVDSGASGAVAHQLHRGTALSATARIDAKPFLNIRHDDVKCTHGSTVGFIDESARHYLMARGMGPLEAESMLIRSSEQQFYAAVPEGEPRVFFSGEASEP